MLGNFLATLRKRRNLTLVSVGRGARQSRFTISQWERGRRRIYADQLAQLLDALDATQEDRLEAFAIAARFGTSEVSASASVTE